MDGDFGIPSPAGDKKLGDNDWFADGEKLLSTLPRKHILLSYVLNAMFASGWTNLTRASSHEEALWFAEQVVLPCCTKAILLPYTMQDPEEEYPFIISAFLCLSVTLGGRFDRTYRLSDLDTTLTYYRQLLRIHIPESIGMKRSMLSGAYVVLVQRKIQLEPASEGAYLDELVTLSASFLPSHSVDARVDVDLVKFLEVLVVWFCQVRRHDKQPNYAARVASHLRVFLGVCRPEYRPQLSMMLALMLNEFHLPSRDDHAEIAELVADNFPLLPSSGLLRSFASIRFSDLLSGTSLDVEEAELSRRRVLLNKVPVQDPFRTEVLRRIAGALLRRHEDFRDESSLEEAQRCLEELRRISESGPESTTVSELRLEDLAYHRTFKNVFAATGVTPTDDPEHPMPDLDVHRRNLERIKLGLEALIQTGTLGAWNRVLRSLSESVAVLCSWGSVEDLDRCIGFLKVTIPNALPPDHHFTRSRHNPDFPQSALVPLFHRRFLLLHRQEDLEETLSMYEATCKRLGPDEAWRQGFIDHWPRLARQTGHPSALRAYESAMLAMQHIVESGPNLQAQHTFFKHGNARGTRTSLDYASYQIEKNQLQVAVEILERGRSLLWCMMRGLRAPIGHLRAVNPDLADKYLSVTHDLESVTTESSVLYRGSSAGASSSSNSIKALEEDSFGRVFEAQRQLLRERKVVISQIRALPGFAHFLAAAPFHSLQIAASSGPIVIINHCEWRSDILIIVHGAPLTHIRLGDDFYATTIALSSYLLEARSSEDGLDSEEYEKALRFVLHELYLLIGRQVIDRLDRLGVPRRSRVWLYPTSVLCSLPLHAMGPIPSDSETDPCKRYFSDIYVCSYTPTLGALIESRAPTGGRAPHQSLDPSLLIVAQPDDPSLKDVSKEIASIESVPGILVSKLVSGKATRQSVTEGLKEHNMVHFACHGLLKEDKPFEASFKLHGGDRLTLLDIIRSRAPNAELAFLSACHTAELADRKQPDEMLHLAAAMQYCGFRGVVGTMWEMADLDGKDMAKNFYHRLLSPRWDASVPIAKRSAKALQYAVQKLRLKRGITTERWVNFVHYGA
ncbi:CHAT domain-containing protein [Gloeopeniophorella convolvens]|nr:CHAT domain-containing protein [Gloeopeniophorella convolvens]